MNKIYRNPFYYICEFEFQDIISVINLYTIYAPIIQEYLRLKYKISYIVYACLALARMQVEDALYSHNCKTIIVTIINHVGVVVKGCLNPFMLYRKQILLME